MLFCKSESESLEFDCNSRISCTHSLHSSSELHINTFLNLSKEMVKVVDDLSLKTIAPMMGTNPFTFSL